MNPVETLAGFADWLDANAAPYSSPLGDNVLVGRWAVMVGADLDEPIDTDFAETALPIYVPSTQYASPVPAEWRGEAISQGSLADRMGHVGFMCGDRRFGPNVAVLALTSADDTISAAMARQGATLDLDSVAVLCLPTYLCASRIGRTLVTGLPILP